jgi:pimeloyl-ACP methyl ester carboxylesterase
MEPIDHLVDIGVRLRVRQWPGNGRPFLLLHGLASNCRTWDRVAEHLHGAGHPVAAVDQRGHGLSDKPASGYDLKTVAADVTRLIERLGWDAPILVGQSWGGTVVLQAAALDPGLVTGIGCVDGGFLDLRRFPDPSWEAVSLRLKPPDLLGTPRAKIEKLLRTYHPEWDAAGIQATLENFETLPDGTVRPWLSLEHHMTIVRSLWELDVPALFSRVAEPVLLCVAEGSGMPAELLRDQVTAAETGLGSCTVRRFPGADHDIHVHRPRQLAAAFLEELESGIWS